MKPSVVAGLAVLLLTSLTPGLARADRFYVAVFGYQREFINAPRYSHTFATFIRTDCRGRVSYFTISWLPETGEVRPARLFSEPGRNFTLRETIDLAKEYRTIVGTWGPYEIKPDLWDRAVDQKAWLESGKVSYKAFDYGSPTGTISNCVHAVTIMARDPGQRNPEVYVLPGSWGESGSYWAALTFRPWYVEPCKVHKELMPAIGLNPDDLRFQSLSRNPETNPLVRAVQSGFQARLLPNRVDCDP